jgi:hypothetical protein
MSRQAGSQAAYSFMYAAPNKWVENYALLNGHVVTVDSLANNDKMMLVYMHLPDGDLRGEGFSTQGIDSLAGLHAGAIPTITSDDGLSTYSQDDIIQSLLWLYNLDHPTLVRTQNYSSNLQDGDHSDHHAAGYFAQEAFRNYDGTAALSAYQGYPMRDRPANLEGGDAVQKLLTFLVYAQHDGAVCQDINSCRVSNTYGEYLPRQYSRVVATHQQ